MSILTSVIAAAKQSAPTGGGGAPTPDILWYKFNGNTNDSSASAVNGTAHNNPSYITGANGVAAQAINFNGSNQSVSFTATSSLSTFTVSFWVNPNSLGGGRNYQALLYGNNASDGILLHGTLIDFWNGLGDNTAASIPSDTWTHIAVVCNSLNCQFYVNGAASGSTFSLVQGMAWNYIGSEDGTSAPFYGAIDDLQLFSTALTSSQISAIYSAGAIGDTGIITSGLQLWWTFDENGGTISGDSSGNNIPMTLYNSPAPVAGIVNSAVQFNGTTNYAATTTEYDATASSDLTVCAWVKFSSIPTGVATIVSQWNDQWDIFYLTVENGYPTLDKNTTLAGGTDCKVVATSQLSANTWYFLCGTATVGGWNSKIYINGTLNNTSTTYTTFPPFASRQPITIGAREAGGNYSFTSPVTSAINFAPAIIDEVRVYGRILSDSEITQIYNGTG